VNRIEYQRFDPLLPPEQADAMLRLCERFGRYGMYAEEGIEDDFGENLAQRHDAVLNFVRTGGRFGRRESIAKLAARTNYFRETYAYDRPVVDGIEPFLHHEGFVDAARRLYGRRVVRPNIVYANLLVPGQELAVHTDVPEFRGINRKKDPQWLIVAMHHSRLFERWRMPIATGVAWFGNPEGGDFVFYPDGPWGQPVALPVRHNTAILLDTDSVFHGVDRVSETRAAMADLTPGMHLRHEGGDTWSVGRGDEKLATYSFSELRFSISWKAYCYADEAEEELVAEHRDDLTRAHVLAAMREDLRKRERLPAEPGNDTELALTIIREYIHYPPPAPPAGQHTAR
jgi:hypothetical protein